MATISRLHTFATSTVIASQEMDDELNQLMSAHNAQDAVTLATRHTIIMTGATIAAGTPGVDDGPGVRFIGSGARISFGVDTAGSGAEVYLAADHYTMPGKTPKLRGRAQLFPNSVPLGVANLQVGLIRIAGSGGAFADPARHRFDAGFDVTIAITNFASPPASTRQQADSGNWPFPANGWYVPYVYWEGTLAGGSRAAVAFQLQLVHVES